MTESMMMANDTDLSQQWQAIAAELASVFNIESSLATLGQRVAETTGLVTVVVMAQEIPANYTAWISDPAGSSEHQIWTYDEAQINELFELPRAAIIDKLEIPAAEVLNNPLWLRARQNILILPLVPANQPNSISLPVFLGLIDVASTTIPDQWDLPTLSLFGRLCIDRVFLFTSDRQHKATFNAISDLTTAISSATDVQTIYALLNGPVRDLLDVEAFSIGFIDPVTGEILFIEQLLGPEFNPINPVRLKRGQGIAGWVAENLEPVIINEAYADKRFFPGFDKRSGFQTRSMICIPLMVGKRPIAVLQALNRRHGKFQPEDLRLLQALGGSLAATLDNAKLNQDVMGEKLRLETLFNTIDEAIITVNPAGIVIQANPAFQILFGSDSDKFTGIELEELMPVREGEFKQFLKRVLAAKGASVDWLVEVKDFNGKWLPVLINGACVLDIKQETGECLLVINDLRQAWEVERMRDDLFENITNEFRTPMATILMYSRLLRRGNNLTDAKSARFLGVIERESDRLQRMVHLMIDVAKLQTHESMRSPEPTNLNSLLEEILPPFLTRAVDKGLLFLQRIQADLPPVYGNDDGLALILNHLIENALKFTPSGKIQLSAWAEAEQVKIEIHDEGIGIPADATTYIFKRFYRAQSAVERGLAGTGLGLYLVKESLRQYNGTISVDSELGIGSTFTVSLPVYRA